MKFEEGEHAVETCDHISASTMLLQHTDGAECLTCSSPMDELALPSLG